MSRISKRMHKSALGSIALAGVLMALGPAAAWAQTAENVRCDKCVDTDDIDNKAVTKKKLAKDSVTSNRIVDGTIKTKDLSNGAVDASKLDDGAVTAGKIAGGAVTADKLAPDAVYGRVIVVRADPVDTFGNCAALQDVLAGITDNGAGNRYLVHLEPGVYDCGATQVVMKAYVDLQGSGRVTSLITGAFNVDSGLVLGADDSELRHLTVENGDPSEDAAIAISSSFERFRVTDVSAVARDASGLIGIFLSGSGSTVLTNVTVETVGQNVSNAEVIKVFGSSTSVELVNVTARAIDGPDPEDVALLVSNGNSVSARNSVFAGGDFAIRNEGTANMVSSQLDRGKTGAGDFFCVGSYDENFAALTEDCGT